MDTGSQEPAMSPKDTSATAPEGSQQQAKQTNQELLEELARLGHRFTEVVQVAWNSEQRKQIEEDLRTGLISVANRLDDTLKKVGDSPQTKEFLDKAEDVAESVSEKVQTSKLGNDLATSLAKGLHALSDELEKLASDMKKSSPAPATKQGESDSPDTDEPKHIPVSHS